MRRHEFIALLAGSVSSSWPPFASLAQGPTKRLRIGFLGGGLPAPVAPNIAAFIEGMSTLGYRAGHDFEEQYLWAEGYLDGLPALAEKLAQAGADVIVAGNNQAAIAAKDATKTIAIVCPNLDDPVGRGLMKSEAKPGGNVTGLMASLPGLSAKLLELARDLIPSVARIALLVNPKYLDVSQRQEIEAAGAALAVTIIAVEARAPDDLDSIFPALANERSTQSSCRGTRFFSPNAEPLPRRPWQRDCPRSTHFVNTSMRAA